MPTTSRGRRDSRAQCAQDPILMRDVLQQLLLSPPERRYRISECRVGPLRRGDGYRHTVQYDLQLHDEASERVWKETVTAVSYGARRTRRIWESLLAEAQKTPRHISSSAFAPFSFVPELDLIVQAFPHDHRLPALAAVIAGPPPEFEPVLLAQFGSPGWQIEQWIANSIRYRVDSRATVRVTLIARRLATGQVETRSFYAKIYRDNEEARQSHDAQLALHDAVEANSVRFSVATPLIHVDRLSTLVQSALSGTTLLQMVRREHDATPAVRNTAKAIADLHRLDLKLAFGASGTPPRSLPNRISRLHAANTLLRSARPDFAKELDGIVAAVVDGLSDVPAAPTHGDLKPDHVLLDEGRVALLDFDFLRTSDPILDVVNMESHLLRAEPHASDGAAARVFVEEYFSHADSDGRARLPHYRAMACLNEAVRSRRRAQPEWRDQIDDVVRQADRMLADAG